VGTERVLVHNSYSPATVQTILTRLGAANSGKWTTFESLLPAIPNLTNVIGYLKTSDF
jgi:hypothetical protein